MNIAEAARINTVLGETLDGLQTMKFVTPYVLEHAEHMARDTSEELASKLVAHRAALQTANEDVTDDVLADSAMSLYRCLGQNPDFVEHIKNIYDETQQASAASPTASGRGVLSLEDSLRSIAAADAQGAAMDGVITYFAQLKAIVQRKLATTVEEEASTRAHFEEVRRGC